MALRIDTLVPAAARLPARKPIKDEFLAIPGARAMWDVALRGPDLDTSGRVMSFPAVVGDVSLVNATPAASIAVHNEEGGPPGLRFDGPEGLSLVGSVSASAWTMAMVYRLPVGTGADTHRFATVGGRAFGFENTSGSANYQRVISTGTNSAYTRLPPVIPGWHSVIVSRPGGGSARMYDPELGRGSGTVMTGMSAGTSLNEGPLARIGGNATGPTGAVVAAALVILADIYDNAEQTAWVEEWCRYKLRSAR